MNNKILLNYYCRKYTEAGDLYEMAERLNELEEVSKEIEQAHDSVKWAVTITSPGGIKRESFSLQLRHIKKMLADARHELRTTLQLEYGRETYASEHLQK